jgi:hypothetical protein
MFSTFRRRHFAAATLIAVAAVAGATTTDARAGTITVTPGHSIQQAIDRARPGDTVRVAAGVYRENLTITTGGITLQGAGDAAGGTVLLPPSAPHDSICTEFGEVNGICVTGYVDPITREPGPPIHNVRVSGFQVRGFSRYGVLLYNGSAYTVSHVQASGNRRYGISGYDIADVRYLDNIAHDNTGGGLQIGDSPRANAVISGNRMFANGTEGGIGLLLRDTSHGAVTGNLIHSNCVGMIVLSTSAARASWWTIGSNVVRDNTHACAPAEEGGPPLSGLGIGLLGSGHVTVDGNTVSGNRPAEDTPLVGGILLASSADLGGADPVATLIRGNTARGNQPADLLWDGSGWGNRFAANTCGRSLPAGIC